MDYDKTVQDIIDYTGLKYDYIRKCLSKFSNIFEPHIKRGDKNSILFDSSSLQIFDQIKQMKEKGFTLNIIEEQLSDLNTLKTDNENIQTPHNLKQTDYFEIMIQEVKDANKSALNAKEQTIQAKDEVLKAKEEYIKSLESKILLITDGRSPEELRQEQKRKEEETRKQYEELINTQNELKRKEIEITSIKALSEDKDNQIIEQKKKEEELVKKEQELSIIKDDIRKKEEEIKSIKLLSDSKDKEILEQKRKEEDLVKKAQELIKTKNDLKNRDDEIDSIKKISEAKDKEIEKQKLDLEEILKKSQEKEEKKKKIIFEIKELDSKFFQILHSKKKKSLLEELEKLS